MVHNKKDTVLVFIFLNFLDDAVKKLTLHMESLEEKTRDILWRLQI